MLLDTGHDDLWELCHEVYYMGKHMIPPADHVTMKGKILYNNEPVVTFECKPEIGGRLEGEGAWRVEVGLVSVEFPNKSKPLPKRTEITYELFIPGILRSLSVNTEKIDYFVPMSISDAEQSLNLANKIKYQKIKFTHDAIPVITYNDYQAPEAQ